VDSGLNVRVSVVCIILLLAHALAVDREIVRAWLQSRRATAAREQPFVPRNGTETPESSSVVIYYRRLQRWHDTVRTICQESRDVVQITPGVHNRLQGLSDVVLEIHRPSRATPSRSHWWITTVKTAPGDTKTEVTGDARRRV
jgi:DNA-binding transcriptional regulator YdaS (Cro superfamily)